MSHSLLLVEDDARLSSLVAGYLRKHGYDVRTVLHGNEAVPAIVEYRPDLVILDINLPGKDGFSIPREARERFDGVIIMVTARDDQFDEVLGLEFGADDYVHKPVEPRVLLARVKAQLRRTPGRGVGLSVQQGCLGMTAMGQRGRPVSDGASSREAAPMSTYRYYVPGAACAQRAHRGRGSAGADGRALRVELARGAGVTRAARLRSKVFVDLYEQDLRSASGCIKQRAEHRP